MNFLKIISLITIKKYLFLIKCDFKLIFNNDFSKPIHIETGFYHNTLFINLKTFLLYPIESFIEKGHTFSHIDDMNISTTNDKRYMTYEYYIQHPMPSIELKFNVNPAKNPHLINSLNRSLTHPLMKKYSHIDKVEK